MCLMLFFFFSSRRRHTRLVSDWSSDVCSSDLAAARDPSQPWLVICHKNAEQVSRRVCVDPQRFLGVTASVRWERSGKRFVASVLASGPRFVDLSNLSDTPHGQYGGGPDDGKDPGGGVKHGVVAAAARQDGRRARRRDGER